MDILVLLSDGFHNLGDVFALVIGLWASKKARSSKSAEFSYGFARTELLGALVNGCFLLSLAFYVFLEAIPRFLPIELLYPGGGERCVTDAPQPWFIIGGATGLGINILGAIVFFVTGKGHSHAGHSHGHDDGHHAAQSINAAEDEDEDDHHGHDHAHGHDDKKKKKKKEHKDHGHDHEHGHDEKKKKKKEHKDKDHGHDHDHDHEHDHDHGHGHEDKDGEKGKKEEGEEEGHDHREHDHGHGHHEGHEHEHGHKKKKKDKKHKKKEDHHEGHEHSHEDHPHHHEDHNLYAIFLHFVGDALSSCFVLTTALLSNFFPYEQNKWVRYVDPAASLIVVIIILWTTVPMVRSVLKILLQKVPAGINPDKVTYALRRIDGVISVHDLHIWELISGLNLASVHLDVRNGVDFNEVLKRVRRVFHKNRIHSVTVQPEFVDPDHPGRAHCEDMCVSECLETWCCEPELVEGNEMF